jgi:hypothetical protein
MRKFGLNNSSANVRFGSIADICSAKRRVRFAPDSDSESGLPQKAMSALPSKADMCGAARDVRYGPIADITPFTLIGPNSRLLAAA